MATWSFCGCSLIKEPKPGFLNGNGWISGDQSSLNQSKMDALTKQAGIDFVLQKQCSCDLDMDIGAQYDPPS